MSQGPPGRAALSERLSAALGLGVFPEEDDRRAAGFVAVLAVVSIGVALLVGLLDLFGRAPDVTSASILLAFCAVAAAPLWLLREGALRPAGRVMFLAAVGASTALVFTGSDNLGLLDAAMMVYPVIVIFGQVALDRRDSARGFALVLGTLLVITAAEVSGLLNPWPSRAVPLFRFLYSAGIVLLAGVASRLIADDLVESRDRSRAHQEALAAVNRQLEGEASRREELIRELESRNAELERFTYTVSHDLKSPLVTIRGFLGFLGEDVRARREQRLDADIGRIVEATDRMKRLLDELLELSRIGRVIRPSERVPLDELAREAVALLEGRIGRVVIGIAPDLPVLYGDRTRLVEVLQNLVENAIKFMGDQPRPRIDIGARRDAEDGRAVVFVRDNGIGIDAEHHARVFGLFDRLDPSREGTGIGLAIVKRIVEVHGGRIWVESEGRGRGSTFCFTLPLASAAARPEA